MDYKIRGHDCKTAVIDMIQVFFPGEKYRALEENQVSPGFIESRYENGLISARFFADSEVVGEAAVSCCPGDEAVGVKLSIYELFKSEYKPPWGILTGIRPAKIAAGMLGAGLSDTEIIGYMENKFKVAKDKAGLCLETAKAERVILGSSGENSHALYIGIPFCPSRCLYCSFTAYPIGKYSGITGRYVEALKKELDYAALSYGGLMPESVYIGGGTPTSLDDECFSELLEYISKIFDTSKLREYTVEAGRPDTITESKLDIMRRFGVSRISVNPQTMQDKTLVKIGRAHTAEEFVKSYALARNKGFVHINVDLILGLPGESEEDAADSLKKITSLAPEEITVHTLALKRASKLKEGLPETPLPEAGAMEKFLRLSKYYMDNFSYKPYYMYRQKNSPGNFENVGYCRPDFGCLYNVQIMRERGSVTAVGAGAVSKFVNQSTGRIERAFNVKNVDEYMLRTDEMIERKIAAYSKAHNKSHYAK